MPGVVAVFTAPDLPEIKRSMPAAYGGSYKGRAFEVPVLAHERARPLPARGISRDRFQKSRRGLGELGRLDADPGEPVAAAARALENAQPHESGLGLASIRTLGLAVVAVFAYALLFEAIGFVLATAVMAVPIGIAFGGSREGLAAAQADATTRVVEFLKSWVGSAAVRR